MKKRQLIKIEENKQNVILSESAENLQEETSVKKSKKAGFTLIELIVVVAVLALLVGLTAGSLVSVNRRKATSVGKIINSELDVLASHAYSRDGAWRLEFRYDEDEECYVLTHQFNTGNVENAADWVSFEEVKLPSAIGVSFGGDEYKEATDEEKEKIYYVAISREKGHYLTEGKFEGYFCDKIFVHSAAKVVTIELSAESGGHRVID